MGTLIALVVCVGGAGTILACVQTKLMHGVWWSNKDNANEQGPLGRWINKKIEE